MFTSRVIRQFGKINSFLVSYKNIRYNSDIKNLVLKVRDSAKSCYQSRHTTSMCEASELSPKDRIVWVDMEMTGLDIKKDHILEIACIVTEQNLNVVAEGPDLVIHHSDHVLNSMGEWCSLHHGKSGLTAASRRSKISTHEAELQILEFLKLHIPKGACPLAGNSIYMDRLFLHCHMPLVDDHLHYRIIDVSTVKELCRRWCPEVYSKLPSKEYGHRALMDIRESIQELQYYRTTVFQGSHVV